MDLRKIVEFYRGTTVTVVTTKTTSTATGEVLDGPIIANTLAIKLTKVYENYPVGSVVFFNPNHIISIG